MEEIRNIFVSTNEGDNYLFYVDKKFSKITTSVVSDYVKVVFKKDVIEAYDVPQHELQYYCIDERYQICEQSIADYVLKLVKNKNAKIKAINVGFDSWCRPLYRTENGKYFCEVDGNYHAKNPQTDPEGEPDYRIDMSKIEIVDKIDLMDDHSNDSK